MANKKVKVEIDTSTEEKIKEAARKVFHKKGYAATRTRDIAEEADINLALLNYYFRSKEKLFNIIMIETLSGFVQRMSITVNDEATTLERKVQLIAENYIELIIQEPEVPVFILSEVRNNPDVLTEKVPIKGVLYNSVFFKQHQQAVDRGEITEPNPFHFFLNILGLIIFPFIASPILKKVGDMQEAQFNQLMLERKKLIPIWIKAMMKAT